VTVRGATARANSTFAAGRFGFIELPITALPYQ
jgi:hypothetical protein